MDLTRQLLAFARCQTVAPMVLDINKAVNSMMNMLKRLIGEDIELIWNPCDQIWPIEIDPSQIDQILANLCVNARDAISGVGKVLIETANIVADEAYCAALHPDFVPGAYAQIMVSDSGMGIDEEIIDKIFEPFFSTKAIGQGTGLGLATVYGIVRQNNGMINVKSEPGVGTTFSVYLPRTTKLSIETQSSNPVEIPRGHNETVLLVEDEIDILELAEAMLRQLGYRVLVANSPFVAINIAEQCLESIDLLVSDVIMPELNGRDLANRLRALIPELPVLYMSGYTANIIADRGFLDKDVRIIQKPFSKRDLATKVWEALTETTH
jgi:CheY-like chemotaxis protein